MEETGAGVVADDVKVGDIEKAEEGGAERQENAEKVENGESMRETTIVRAKSMNVRVTVEEDDTAEGGSRTKTSFEVPIEKFRVARVESSDLVNLPSATRMFYRRQNRVIDHMVQVQERKRRKAELASRRLQPPALTEALTTVVEETDEEDDLQSFWVRLAINLSFGANLVMFGLKIASAIVSGSLAVVGSSIESALDLISGGLLFLAAREVSRNQPYKFPAGRTRLEPLTIIVFASIMGTASLALLKEGVQSIARGFAEGPPTLNVDPVTYSAMGLAVGMKICLLILCWSLRNESPSVKALAQDHINDSLSNSVTLISVSLASLGGLTWIIDPLCACALALYVMVTWIQTGWEHVTLLSGRGADPQILSAITREAVTHDPRIEAVELVRAYHFGSRLLVEVDIVMPPETSLRVSHDVGESLQRAIEKRPEVERAFVHVDWDADHAPEEEHGTPQPSEE